MEGQKDRQTLERADLVGIDLVLAVNINELLE